MGWVFTQLSVLRVCQITRRRRALTPRPDRLVVHRTKCVITTLVTSAVWLPTFVTDPATHGAARRRRPRAPGPAAADAPRWSLGTSRAPRSSAAARAAPSAARATATASRSVSSAPC